MSYPKTFEDFRELVWEDRAATVDHMLEIMDEETSSYQLGVLRGEIRAYDEILGRLRNIIKYSLDGNLNDKIAN